MKRKFWDFNELEQRRRAIKSVVAFRRNKKMSFRDIAKETGLAPVQACDIWDTNKNNQQLDYL